MTAMIKWLENGRPVERFETTSNLPGDLIGRYTVCNVGDRALRLVLFDRNGFTEFARVKAGPYAERLLLGQVPPERRASAWARVRSAGDLAGREGLTCVMVAEV